MASSAASSMRIATRYLAPPDQRGLQPVGGRPLTDGTLQLRAPENADLRTQFEHAFVLVQQAGARQDAILARALMTTESWETLAG